MTEVELRAKLPEDMAEDTKRELVSLYQDADYLYGRAVYGCECLDGYYRARQEMDREAGEKLAKAGELHYTGLVTILTALCGEAMTAVSVLYDGPEYCDGGIMRVMDGVTELSDQIGVVMQSRGVEPGPPDPMKEGFEGPAGEMARRAVGVGAVVERHRGLDQGSMLDDAHLNETYMVLRGMLQSGCDILRYAVWAVSGEDLPEVRKPAEAGAALVVGPVAASMKKLAARMEETKK